MISSGHVFAIQRKDLKYKEQEIDSWCDELSNAKLFKLKQHAKARLTHMKTIANRYDYPKIDAKIVTVYLSLQIPINLNTHNEDNK